MLTETCVRGYAGDPEGDEIANAITHTPKLRELQFDAYVFDSIRMQGARSGCEFQASASSP